MSVSQEKGRITDRLGMPNRTYRVEGHVPFVPPAEPGDLLLAFSQESMYPLLGVLTDDAGVQLPDLSASFLIERGPLDELTKRGVLVDLSAHPPFSQNQTSSNVK